MAILTIESKHVLHDLQPLPATRDPFDRLLLAQAGVEGMRLVTLDGVQLGLPLAWTPSPSGLSMRLCRIWFAKPSRSPDSASTARELWHS